MTKVIDCRRCKNCDLENDRCKIYGFDAKSAAETCALKNFGAYCPRYDARTDEKKSVESTSDSTSARWIPTGTYAEWYSEQYRCSHCGTKTLDNGNFCSSCGHPMRKGKS